MAKTKAAHREVKSGCTLEASLQLIGGRWKAVVIHHLLDGKRRFGELRRLLPRCTQRMLTLQLRELERDGLVKRTVYTEVPPRVEYELTDFGRSLRPVLESLYEWGERYRESGPNPPDTLSTNSKPAPL